MIRSHPTLISGVMVTLMTSLLTAKATRKTFQYQESTFKIGMNLCFKQ